MASSIPFLTVTTERLVIRPLQSSDYESWYQGFDKRRPAQTLFDEGYLDMTPCNQVWFDNLVAHHHKLWQSDQQYIFAVFTHDGHHVGMLNLATLARANMDWADFGYSIHNYLWRQSYAFAALQAFLSLAKNQLRFHRLDAHVDEENTPSQALLIKLGFEREGICKAFHYQDEAWVDQVIYAKNL
ncbi:RimJ/RimL family protein N-acetyltransferase [Streptococcus rupicaprae]|uniref:RimJ/RimL family protein N-acetyltransferase n=1 Tax=Streptococcus rupicaprae TaxID=759619 RepID=A0ABV2FIG0_9STRE